MAAPVIQDSAAAGSSIGVLLTYDQDHNQTHSYHIHQQHPHDALQIKGIAFVL